MFGKELAESIIETHKKNGVQFEFGKKIGISEKRVKKMMSIFCEVQVKAIELIEQSFLTESSKTQYKELYENKVTAFAYIFKSS